MQKIISVILAVFIATSQASMLGSPCSSEINTSLGFVNQLIVSLKGGEVNQIKKDFLAIEQIVKSIDSTCSSSIWQQAQAVPSVSSITCTSVVQDVLNELNEFQRRPINSETDIFSILWLLMERSLLFSTSCFSESKVELRVPVQAAPKPECIAQAYQALDVLYQFQADSESEDSSSLKDDYATLLEVTTSLNDYCVPLIVVNTTVAGGNGNCQSEMSSIHNIMTQFTQGDPTNYLNVIQTIQGLWNEQPAFSADCNQRNQQVEITTYSTEAVEKCHKALSETFDKVIKISEDAMVDDLKGILGNIYELKMSIFSMNNVCDASLHVELFPRVESIRGNCNEHFVTMRNLFSTSKVERVEDFAQMTQRVWTLASRFLHDC